MKPRNRKSTPPSQPKVGALIPSEIERIKEVLAKEEKRVNLAAKMGVSESRISEYLLGDRRPTPEGWIKLGNLSLKHSVPDPFYFWERAGIGCQDVQSMAYKIDEARSVPLLEGEVVRLPEYREAFGGRVATGAMIPLPARFIPHPERTICLLVDECAPVVDVPRGLFILDQACEGAEKLTGLENRVVMIRHEGIEEAGWAAGLYAGRLTAEYSSRSYSTNDLVIDIYLAMLGKMLGHYNLPLGSVTVQGATKGLDARQDGEEIGRRTREAIRMAWEEFMMPKKARILGKVQGRLTGHLEKARE